MKILKIVLFHGEYHGKINLVADDKHLEKTLKNEC